MKKSFFLCFFLILSLSLLHCEQIRILGIGAPCVDLSMSVDESFLDRIQANKGGSKQISWKEFSSILSNQKPLNINTGGSCANTLKGLAQIGEPCALLGKIGNDEMGDFFMQVIEPLGVTSLLIPSPTPTAQVLCMITPDKQRTFRCFPGAGNEFTQKDLLPHYFENVEIVHFEGYTLYNDKLTEEAMQLARESGALVSFDLGSFELVQHFKKRIWDLLSTHVDIVFANEDETFALTDENPKKGCQILQNLCPISVVLIGKKGCLVGANHQIYHIETEPKIPIDTTGAGDLFISGFLHGILQGCSLEECAAFGNQMGGAVIQCWGAEIPKEKIPKLRRES